MEYQFNLLEPTTMKDNHSYVYECIFDEKFQIGNTWEYNLKNFKFNIHLMDYEEIKTLNKIDG